MSIIMAVCFSVNLVLGVRFFDLRSSASSSMESSVDSVVDDVVLASEEEVSDLMETIAEKEVVTSLSEEP